MPRNNIRLPVKSDAPPDKMSKYEALELLERQRKALSALVGKGHGSESEEFAVTTKGVVRAVKRIFQNEPRTAETKDCVSVARSVFGDSSGGQDVELVEESLGKTRTHLAVLISEVSEWADPGPEHHTAKQVLNKLDEFIDRLDSIEFHWKRDDDTSTAKHSLNLALSRIHEYLAASLNPTEASKVYGSIRGVGFTDERAAVVYPLCDVRGLLKGLVDDIEEEGVDRYRAVRTQPVSLSQEPPSEAIPEQPTALDRVIRLCKRFPRFVRATRTHRKGHTAIEVKNEYDVQYVMSGLLHVEFDDVRPEEPTPSYAGASARADFILKDEQIFIEVKMTRPGLDDRKVGEELTLDINKYTTHPDCKTLVCFVYDPHRHVANPTGLISDLTAGRGNVHVIIST